MVNQKLLMKIFPKCNRKDYKRENANDGGDLVILVYLQGKSNQKQNEHMFSKSMHVGIEK